MRRSLKRTEEVKRILDIPRRQFLRENMAEVAQRLTDVLKTSGGKQALRDVQGMALHDAGIHQGAFLPIRVGGGKTLITMLAPIVMHAKRPVLLLPATLIAKTENERRQLSSHWNVAKHLRLVSYEALGRVGNAETLEQYKPDLIIADECHRLKNKRAAVTRRVIRYMDDHPDTNFVALSGTVIKKSIKDFAHIIRWCLKDNTPLPNNVHELDEWAAALDEGANPLARMDPGPLGVDVREARAWFAARLSDTPGVVIHEGKDTDASLVISALEYNLSPEIEAQFETLRTLCERPDGYALADAVSWWRVARELALGFYAVWDPPAPSEWLDARRNWAHHVRETITKSQKYDSELQVRNAVAAGDLQGKDLLDAWENIKDTFTIQPKDRWHDESALQACEGWLKENVGIVFCGHDFFARELSRRTGLPYYGAEGKNSKGQYIGDENGKTSCIASLAANGTGRNLQMFHKALITTNINGPDALEQLLGREHRQGQTADEVEYTFLVGCYEHIDGMWRCFEGTKAAEQLTGMSYKLTSTCDLLFPSRDSLRNHNGYRWKKTGA